MKLKWIIGVVVAAGGLASLNVAAQSVDSSQSQSAAITELRSLPAVLDEVETPEIADPQWLVELRQPQAATSPAPTTGDSRVVTYTVSTKGQTESSFEEFAAQANQTLNHDRGWSQLGLEFQRVQQGGSFNLILSQASQVPSFSSGCSAEWSCRVGVSVIINDDRWSGATTAWNQAGGGLRDYRHMVINHEVGHWLGHGHPTGCTPDGSLAPVMLQQSIDLKGCQFNPWPLDSELHTTR